jgi:hydroxymethylpyrimidine pyrophosphatase-like HAD family hydrolase
MKFKAVMMDFDGTVTKKGSVFPSKKMIQTLIAVAKKMPIAFCTGRQLESFQKRGLSAILKEIPRSEKNVILSNMFLLGENGAMGYSFDQKIGKYKEFYRAKWPDKFLKKSKLKKMIGTQIEKYGEIINEHRVIVVMRAHRMDKSTVKEIYEKSAKMFEICDKTLSEYDKNYEKYLHLGDSGIGVIVCPAKGDKDASIEKFAKFLAQKKAMKFGKNFKEILVIGDSAKKGGNDYYFLQGKYGTPFTVGYYDKKSCYPSPVLNSNNKRLLNDDGTIYLLDHILDI